MELTVATIGRTLRLVTQPYKVINLFWKSENDTIQECGYGKTNKINL